MTGTSFKPNMPILGPECVSRSPKRSLRRVVRTTR